jgi:hypothetical protein
MSLPGMSLIEMGWVDEGSWLATVAAIEPARQPPRIDLFHVKHIENVVSHAGRITTWRWGSTPSDSDTRPAARTSS